MLTALLILFVVALIALAIWAVRWAKESKGARVALGGLLLLAGLGAAMDAPHRAKIEDAEKDEEEKGTSGAPPSP
jgi:hypothetical protein